MLTLTRSVGERILIGDDIIIEVRAVLDGKQVRISIDAPRQVPIHRAEVFEAVTNANLAAVASSGNPVELARSIGAALPASPVEATRSATPPGSGSAPDPGSAPATPGRPLNPSVGDSGGPA